MIEVTAMGLICAIGSSCEQVVESLKNVTKDSMVRKDNLLVQGKSSFFGTIKTTLPTIDPQFKAHDSRNNRVLLHALNQIKDPVDSAIERYGHDRIGIILGTTTSGLEESDKLVSAQVQGKSYDDFSFTAQELGDGSLFLSQYLKLTGPAYTISTACSSSARAIISAMRLISGGVIDAAIVGGADTLCRMPINGFDSLESLSYDICRPFSAKRDGINIGEAGGLVLLEKHGSNLNITKDHLLIVGAGESSDSYHISAPHPQGIGAIEAMNMALSQANLKPSDIGYVNTHGTATILNDKVESLAINSVLGNQVPCSSMKYLLGHTLGAAGICEAIISLLMLKYDVPLLVQNCSADQIDSELSDCAIVTKEGQAIKSKYIMSNSFAFGGNNVSLILSLVN